MDITAWLHSLALGEYGEAFARNHIDAALLPALTSEDLKDLGVASVGHRKKLLLAIAELAESGPASESGSAAEQSSLAEGERRQVTVLFADLSNYTGLTSELDAEELHQIMAGFFTTVDSVVESYGGTVDKHIGDSVMAVFGAPVAHGNDPERAVRAALAIHSAAMPPVSEAAGRQLQVHIGIASGQVVASPDGGPGQTFAVTGESVNLASRLTDAAEPGETLISKAVYQAVSSRILAEEVGEIAVKGLRRPVGIWRVVGVRDYSVGEAGRLFVGRRAELAQFQGVLTASRDSGSGLAVYIRGEAGIGKTRLVEEFQRLAAEHGFVCHSALILDFGVAEGRDAIRVLVRSLLGLPPHAELEARRTAVERVLVEGVLEPDRRVFLNDLLDLPQATEQRAVYDAMDHATRVRGRRAAVADLVRRLSSPAPILLTVEDLHSADSISLSYLSELAVAVAECPALLLMTSRIEGDPIDEAWRGATRGSPLLTMDIGPLRHHEAIALAGASAHLMPRLATACIERAEGNPLFLEQLLRSAEDTAAAHLPGSIQSIVLARVDGLDPLDKRALQAASIIGQRFALDALRHLMQAPSYTCKGLVKHYLVRSDGEEFLFAHALIWEGVYSSLLQARKRELHQRAAGWFAERDPALYAAHLDRAEDPGAPRAYLEAARAQLAAYRPGRALKLVDRGLVLASEPCDLWAMTCLRGAILHDLGSIYESIEAYRTALERADDDAQRCEAWLGMVAGMRVTDQFDEAFQVLDQAESAARRLGQASALARVHHLRGSLYFPLGNIDGCLQQHELALKFAQTSGSAELEARALSGLADANSMKARIKTAHEYFDRSIELAQAHGFGRIEVANRHMRGIMRYYQNRLRSAAEDTLAGAEGAAKVGHHRAEMVARAASGYILPDLGELDAAKQQSERALALARRLGARRFEASSLRHLARVMAAQGERAGAITLLQEAYAISCESGITFSGPWALGALAVIADDAGTREWALQEGEKILARGCVFHNYFWFYRDGIEVSLRCEDWDRVERYADALERFTGAEPVPWTSFFIGCGRALAAFGRGTRDQATLRELVRLRDEAEQAGFASPFSALEKALALA